MPTLKEGIDPQFKSGLVSLRNFPSAKKRREHLEDELKASLSVLGSPIFEDDDLVHCENLIGSTQVPLGVAGPIVFGKSLFYIPLATTEGALVASVSRGCKALVLSNGVITTSIYHGQTRGPVFETQSIEKGLILQKWIEVNTKLLQKEAEKTSGHILYKSAKIKNLGTHTYIRFSFDTKDAMGMNMVTIATEAMVELIEKETKIKCLSVAGNFDIDKKASWLNTIEGRGFEVWAEGIVPEKVLKEVLHTTASSVYKTWIAKCMLGSYAAGALGFNSHFANVVAAIFIATGQDPAHVVEGSSGITICEVRGDDLYISINMPSLLVGTVGGGTVLPSQTAALSIMGVTNKSSSKEFAQKIGIAVLSGELSLLSALSTRTLGAAHKKLGRKKI